ncbi:hypothetical protein [Bacillus sp. REN16]|uniref:hypothetical protein n=1 Tax=Bacillus sp. REN16 TaxID=2887296 RepID=UPI001E5DB6B6|nr:hypothetical protein [Bacillus sp. REN16]MCC3356761.1 hypothetical protein [Bacillus sp. REN16]
MATKREDVYKLIEAVPDEKLSELVKMIKLLTMPEDEPTKTEINAISVSRSEYENGETYSYTIDELRKEFLDDE